MDARSRYQRIFLIFSPEDTGFGVGQEPSGYVKIEVNNGKGKLLASVQNLNGNRGYSYKLYLIKCTEKGFSHVCAGVIPITRNRGEMKWEFNSSNVDGTGIPVQEFNVAVVIGEDEKTDNMIIICPLAAYKNEKVHWREYFRKTLRVSGNKETQVKDEEEKPVEPDETPEEFVENRVADTEENEITSRTEYELESTYSGVDITSAVNVDEKNVTANNMQNAELTEDEQEVKPTQDNGQEENQIQDSSQEANLTQDNNPEEEPVTANENEAIEDKELEESNQHIDDFDEYQHMLRDLEAKERAGMEDSNLTGCNGENSNFCMPLQNSGSESPCQNCQIYRHARSKQPVPAKQGGNIEKFRINLDKYFETYDPFRSRRRDYRWWKVGSPVQLNNILYQCDIKTPLLFNPALMMAHFKYRHLIVGIYSDRMRRREYIVCGIPGVYNIDERPFGNMCRWAQVEGNRPRHGAFGYWLVYIDGKTGRFLSVN